MTSLKCQNWREKIALLCESENWQNCLNDSNEKIKYINRSYVSFLVNELTKSGYELFMNIMLLIFILWSIKFIERIFCLVKHTKSCLKCFVLFCKYFCWRVLLPLLSKAELGRRVPVGDLIRCMSENRIQKYCLQW